MFLKPISNTTVYKNQSQLKNNCSKLVSLLTFLDLPLRPYDQSKHNLKKSKATTGHDVLVILEYYKINGFIAGWAISKYSQRGYIGV